PWSAPTGWVGEGLSEHHDPCPTTYARGWIAGRRVACPRDLVSLWYQRRVVAKRGSSRPRKRDQAKAAQPRGARRPRRSSSSRVTRHADGIQVELEVGLDEPDDDAALRRQLAQALGTTL